MTEPIRELQLTLKDDPSNREVFDTLADMYAQEGDWRRLRWHFEKFASHLDGASDFSQLVFVLRELAEAEDDPKECSAILVALGDVLFEHVDNHEEGMDAYQRAFKTYPADTTSLDRARRVYREAGQFKRVLLLYDLERRVKEGSDHEADVLVRIAQVHGDYLGDHETALDTLDEALDHDAEHPLATTVKEIYEAGGSVESAVKDKVREAHETAGHGDEAGAAALMMEAATLERTREGGGLREAAELAEKARSFEPSNFEAGQFLMEVYEELEQRDELRELTDALEAEAGKEGEEEEKEDAEEADEAQELDEDSLAADGGQASPAVEEAATFEGSFDQARQRLDDDPADLLALKAVTSGLREEGAVGEGGG
jgi:golgin subfamily B member 1